MANVCILNSHFIGAKRPRQLALSVRPFFCICVCSPFVPQSTCLNILYGLQVIQCLYIYLSKLFSCRGSGEIILKRCNSSFFNISHIIADENNYSLQVLHHLPTLQTRLAIIGDYINLCRRLARQRPVQHNSPRTHTHTAGTREEAVGRGEGPWEAVR